MHSNTLKKIYLLQLTSAAVDTRQYLSPFLLLTPIVVRGL